MSPLTPYDIHNKVFKRSTFRGYDVDEVNDFLDEIIRDYEQLIREKMELEQQVEDLQNELESLMEEGAEPGYNSSLQQTQPQPQATAPRFGQQTSESTSLQPAVSSLSSMEQSIHKSIRVAQEVAEEVRLNAKKEAELIVQEAEKNADRIINEALQKARAIHSELMDLRQKATVYRARFRTLVQSHLDILENSDWESLEELEMDLDETGRQLEQYSEQPQEELLIDQPTHDFQTLEESNVMEEVAPTYLEEEEEPRRELRRSSRKLKKKAMF